MRAKTKAKASESIHTTVVRPSGSFFQKKPTLQHRLVSGRPGDAYEREADNVADVVTRGDGASAYHDITPIHRGSMQREAVQAFGERGAHVPTEEEPLQAQAAEEEEPVQAQVEEEEEPVQAQVDEEEPVQAQVEEEEEPVHAQVDDEDEPVQAQVDDEEPVQAQVEGEEEPVQAQVEEEDDAVQAQVDDEEEPVQAQVDDEEEPVQARSAGAAEPVGPAGVRTGLRTERGRGQPIPDAVRRPLEVRFDADFSGIRIHTNDPAVKLTRALNAQAFTQGRDIYFNDGRFAPGTTEGDHLLAHELTHTIQQGAAPPLRAEGAPRSGVGPRMLQLKENDAATVLVRPELLEAIKLGRSQIGKVNAKDTNADGTRIGWERLYDFFFTAFGQKEVIHRDVIKYFKKVKDQNGELKDPLPSWCGIFVWWCYKTAGIPIVDWKLGTPILNETKKRAPNELPRKGDIAYASAFQHFGMVTGIESPESAEGKYLENIRIATLNGNTVGNDNLGGQVEEKWDPKARWLGFFDPVANLGMPDVPLVEVGREPEPFEPGAEKAEEKAANAEAAAEAPLTDVSALQEEEITSEPDLPAEGEPEVPVEPPEPPAAVEPEPEVEVPAPPPAPAAEEVAKVEPLPLDGPSDAAMVSFTSASPSQMAATHPGLGGTLDGKIGDEKQALADEAPVLVAQTSGKVEEGITPPDQIPVPSDAAVSDGVTGTDPGALQPKPHQDFGAPPTNESNERTLDEKEEGGLIDWLRNNFSSFMSRIRTKDPNVNTSAGERPNVKLEAEADPGRIDRQRQDAGAAMVAQRDETTAALKNHPGQQNIQPREVHEERKAAISPEKDVEIETTADAGVEDYAQAPLAADVRAKADELLKPNVDANMTPARRQTEQAADRRDADKAKEVQHAEDEAARISRDADADQRRIVVDNRKEVARQQTEGIEDAYGHVNDFNREADTEQTTARKEIGDKVKEAEQGARKELEKGEEDARKEKEAKEKEAAEAKRKLDKEQGKKSWWDRVASAIKKAVKALTKAIDTIFNKLREAVKTIIEKAKNLAVGLINAARDWVVDKLNKFRDWAKGMVDKYLKEHFPGLAAAINAGIDGVVDAAVDGVNFVADSAIEAVEALADSLAAALDKVLSVFQTALKAAVEIAGAVMTGDFAEALRIAIRAACDIAGIAAQPIFDFIDRAAAQIMSILKDPKSFFDNVVAAVGAGVRGFMTNIKKHLIGGLIGWLTGALSEAAVTLPETFDAKGIFSLVMQILGLTYANIKAKVIKRFPPAAKVFTVIEKGYALIKRLVTEGPVALWEEAKQALSTLKETVLGAIRSFVITTVVKEAITWLLGLLNPAGALVKILKLIYDFVMFLVERFQQIKDFVMSVYDSITAIASGAIGKAAAAVEDAMARSLPVVISLLASLAGLGGIGKTIKDIVGKISKPVYKILDKVIDKIVAFAKKLLKKGKAAAGKAKEAISNWWKAKKTFTTEDGETHKLYFKGTGKSATLMIASNPGKYEAFIDAVDVKGKPAKVKSAKTKALGIAKKIDGLRNKDPKTGMQEKKIVPLLNDLAKYTKILASGEPETPPSVINYGSVKGHGGGKSMHSEILSSDAPEGTKPTDNPPIWQEVSRRKRKSGYPVYVQGHLLNHLLGGPGRAYNLTPITGSANGQHERDVEKPVWQLVQAGEVVEYSVKVVYSAHPARSYRKTLANKKNRSKLETAKLELMKYEEMNMAKRLECKWELLTYDKKKKKWVREGGTKGSKEIPIGLPDGKFILQM